MRYRKARVVRAERAGLPSPRSRASGGLLTWLVGAVPGFGRRWRRCISRSAFLRISGQLDVTDSKKRRTVHALASMLSSESSWMQHDTDREGPVAR